MKTKNKVVEIDWTDIDRQIGKEAAIELLHSDQRRKRIRSLFEMLAIALGIALIWLALSGCVSGRNTYTTLASTEKAVVLSYEGYLDSVIKGQTRTNELPIVAKSFDVFQAEFRVAVDAASGNTNGPVTGDLSTKAANLIQQITNAKSQPK